MSFLNFTCYVDMGRKLQFKFILEIQVFLYIWWLISYVCIVLAVQVHVHNLHFVSLITFTTP